MATIAGYLTISCLLTTMGELLVHTVVGHPVLRWDIAVSRWFAAGRAPGLERLSRFGSALGNTMPVVVAALLIAVALIAARRWREVPVVVVALSLELAVFLTVNEIVGRPRPDVVRLGSTPTTASFPSGHTAATVVLYGALALHVGRSARPGLARPVAGIGLAMTVFVAWSRVYRGMHHVTDVVAGAAMGAACLFVAWWALSAFVDRDRGRSARATAAGSVSLESVPPGSVPAHSVEVVS